MHTLWRVPLYCAVAGWVGYYISVYLGGFFFTVQTMGADGIIQLSADPVRSAVFHGVLFLATLLIGGLLVFRSMTRREIALSAAITAAIYLTIVLAQLYLPDFPLSLSFSLAKVQNWTGTISSLFRTLTGNLSLSVILASFSPLLFIPFGQRATD